MPSPRPAWLEKIEARQALTYPLAVVRSSAHRGEATAYAAFLLGPKGREVLARHGFTTP